MVNQVEFSPYLYNKALMEKCKAKNIQLQSYTPLVKGKKMMDPKLLDIAANYIKTPAQVLLRWQLQHGLSAIPKSGHPQRLEENFQIFDFEITREDMLKLDSLNEDLRLCPNPLEML
jgi:diketogulonate reductase-like aldo/keto reductase